MINESGTMSGGGGKPRGGRMCLGNAAPRTLDTQAATAELAQAEQELGASQQVVHRMLAACTSRTNFFAEQRERAEEAILSRSLHGAARLLQLQPLQHL